MMHWTASSILGLLLTGRYQPVCAAVYAAPDCAGRLWFIRAMDWAFGEADHCRRVWATYQVGRAVSAG